MLSWICAECGSPTESKDVESIDTGTDLVCEYCHKHTVVELHTVEGYRKANEMVLQIEGLQKTVVTNLKGWADAADKLDVANRLNGELRKALEFIASCDECDKCECADHAKATLSEKRNCDCGIVLPAPGSMCAKCGKVNIRG